MKKKNLFSFIKQNKSNYSIYPSFFSENNNHKKNNIKIKLYNDILKEDYYILPLKFCNFRNCYVFDIPKTQFDNKSNKYEIINLSYINSIQIIDEMIYNDDNIDIDKLDELTISRNDCEEVQAVPLKKHPLYIFGIILLFIIIGLFLYINPEIIIGKDIKYV